MVQLGKTLIWHLQMFQKCKCNEIMNVAIFPNFKFHVAHNQHFSEMNFPITVLNCIQEELEVKETK